MARTTAGSKFTPISLGRSSRTRERPRPTLRAVWGPFVGEAGAFELSGENVLKEQGFEGLVAKRRNSVYESGLRTGAWMARG